VYTFEFACKDNISLRAIRHQGPFLYSYTTGLISILRRMLRLANHLFSEEKENVYLYAFYIMTFLFYQLKIWLLL
jgi:hypothetical protein